MDIKLPIKECWIVTEGMAGTENQCLGVADALGIEAQLKRITLKQPWRLLSPYLGFEHARIFKPRLEAPWPDLLLTSGRKAIAAARYIKKASKGKTFTTHIQDPRISPKGFDLVALPAHDPTYGENVITTIAAPNRITPKRLEIAKAQHPEFGKTSAPRVAVLIGGNSKSHQLTTHIMQTLATQLKALNASFMITTSRRTGAHNEAILRAALDGSDAYIWDGQGDNPYFAILGWADYILVTSDSTSMLSDAGTTGRPVYMITLDGGGTRIDTMHQNLINAGIVRIFDGHLEDWTYDPLNDTQIIAQEIMRRMNARTGL